jgi:hypothetical protein
MRVLRRWSAFDDVVAAVVARSGGFRINRLIPMSSARLFTLCSGMPLSAEQRRAVEHGAAGQGPCAPLLVIAGAVSFISRPSSFSGGHHLSLLSVSEDQANEPSANTSSTAGCRTAPVRTLANAPSTSPVGIRRPDVSPKAAASEIRHVTGLIRDACSECPLGSAAFDPHLWLGPGLKPDDRVLLGLHRGLRSRLSRTSLTFEP